MSKQSDLVKVSQDAGSTGFVNTTGDTMTGPLTVEDTVVGMDWHGRIASNTEGGAVFMGTWSVDGVAKGTGVMAHSQDFNAWQDLYLNVHRNDSDQYAGGTYNTVFLGGRVRMPHQPRASASDTRGGQLSGEITGSNFYDTIRANVGNHLNASTGRFTCPVDGIYRLYFRFSTYNGANVRLQKNGGTITEAYAGDNGNIIQSVSAEIVVPCSAGDYLSLQTIDWDKVVGTQHAQVTFELLG